MERGSQRRMFFGVSAGLAAASIWGGMYVVSKVVLDVIPAFTLITLRLVLGALSLMLILAIRGVDKPGLRTLSGAVAIGFVGYGASLGLQFIGTHLSTAVNASLVTSASPLFIFFFGVLLLGEKPTPERIGALVLAFLGVIAVIDPKQAVLGTEVALGNLILLGAALTWGLYSVLVKRISIQIGTMEFSVLAFLGGLLLSAPITILKDNPGWFQFMTPGLWLGVLYLGVVSTGLAMYLWNYSLAMLDAGLVSLLFFAQPVVGTILGALLLGETLTSAFWLGAMLIGAGLILVTRPTWGGKHSRAGVSQARGRE
jgi:drug/metabolite transporter (DMT)-like permease